jgi:predicted GH43/DUF377 family glycosyl hydrolase
MIKLPCYHNPRRDCIKCRKYIKDFYSPEELNSSLKDDMIYGNGPIVKRGSVEPLFTKILNLDTEQTLNPSIVNYNSKIVFCYRKFWYASKLYISYTNEDYSLVDKKEISIKEYSALEDPRLFIHKDNLYLSCISLSKTKHKISQIYLSLDQDLNIKQVYKPRFKDLKTTEKNWQFFSVNNKLYCIYSLRPYKVFEVIDNDMFLIKEQYKDIPWEYGYIRGGSSPILLNNNYYSFFHSTQIENNIKYYYMGVLKFSSVFPFGPISFTPEPILVPDIEEEKYKDWYAKVVFPCGSIVERDSFIVSYGYQDHECRLSSFNIQDIENKLCLI